MEHDKALENWGCIHEAKGHYIHLIGSEGHDKGGEPFLTRLNLQLVVSQLHIEFGEVS